MTAAQTTFAITTTGQGLYEFTDSAVAFVARLAPKTALLTLFVQHTSCSLLIQENADPAVQADLKNYFTRLAPPSSDRSMSYLTHTSEGPDDMPAHIKAALTQTSITIPISERHLMLGTWQGIYLFEHRDRRRQRMVVAHISA